MLYSAHHPIPEGIVMANICILISIVLYLVFMLLVGFWYTKRNTNADDF